MEKLKAGAQKLGIELSERQLAQFQIFYETLIEWNQKFNLTAITEYDAVQINHFLDSLTVVLAWKPEPDTRPKILDVGTGAGLPGIALKIAFPRVRLVLLDATNKKALFLNTVLQKLGISGVEIITARAEDAAHLHQNRQQFDVVLARALAPLAVLAELTIPFAKAGGLVIAHKKGNIELELEQSRKAISIMGGQLEPVVPVVLPEFPDERRLVVIKKITATPIPYPRKPGTPAKEPFISKIQNPKSNY